MRPQLLLLVLVAVLAGCGGGDDGGAEGTTTGGGGGGTAEGAAVFDEAGCGGCHTFSPANSSGSVGPNLDDANVTFEQAKEQITNGGGGMPAFKGDLTAAEIDSVARFVSEGGGSSSGAGAGTSAIAPFSP